MLPALGARAPAVGHALALADRRGQSAVSFGGEGEINGKDTESPRGLRLRALVGKRDAVGCVPLQQVRQFDIGDYATRHGESVGADRASIVASHVDAKPPVENSEVS
jgi:hypothetical protein